MRHCYRQVDIWALPRILADASPVNAPTRASTASYRLPILERSLPLLLELGATTARWKTWTWVRPRQPEGLFEVDIDHEASLWSLRSLLKESVARTSVLIVGLRFVLPATRVVRHQCPCCSPTLRLQVALNSGELGPGAHARTRTHASLQANPEAIPQHHDNRCG